MLNKQDSNKLLKGIKKVIFTTSLAVSPITVGAEEINDNIIKITFIDDEFFKFKAIGVGIFVALGVITVANNIIMDKYKELDKLDEVDIVKKKKNKNKNLFNK